MSALQTIEIGVAMMILSALVNAAILVWGFRWKKRESFPEELQKEIRQLTKDMVTVRGQIKYIEGRLNGKHWKLEG